MGTVVRGSSVVGGVFLLALAGSQASWAQSSGASSPSVTELAPIEVRGLSVPTATGEADGFVASTAVSATKSDTPLIETPQAISVVTRAQMDAQAAQTVGQALRYTPGVVSEIRGNSNDGSPYLYSRGFIMEQYLDGARLPGEATFGYAAPNFDTYGLERIDVLHGPASVLYGQVNPGGIANLVSKRPTTTPLHELFVTTGNHGLARAGFDFGGALTPDGTWSYRLTGDGDYNNTQVDHVKQSHVFIAPSLTWRPDADTSLTLMAKLQRDPDVGYYNFAPAIGTVLDNPAGKISSHTNLGDPDFDHQSKTQASVGYEFEHRFNPVFTFRQNLHYTYIKDDLANVFGSGLAAGSNTTLNRYAFFNNESGKFFSVDNQLQAKFDTGPVSHTALVGLDYQRILYKERVGLGAAPSIDVFSPVYTPVTMPAAFSDDLIRMKQLGVYGQDQIEWGKWRLLVGGRQDWASQDDDNPLTSSYESQAQHAFTWRSGLVYLFDNGVAPYVSFSKSFQPQVGEVEGGGAAQPTRAKQYEVGVKYQPPGYNSFITAALFDLTENNVLTGDPTTGLEIQTGQVRARGVELEGHASLSKNLNVVASYAYLHNVTTQSNDTTTTIDGTQTPLQGKQPFGVPRNMASAWADYTLHGGSLSGLGFGGGLRYLSASYDTSNSIRVPSVTLVDAAVHYDTGKHWLFSLNAQNLFNRQYIASCFGSTTCTFGDGVTVLASARYRW